MCGMFSLANILSELDGCMRYTDGSDQDYGLMVRLSSLSLLLGHMGMIR